MDAYDQQEEGDSAASSQVSLPLAVLSSSTMSLHHDEPDDNDADSQDASQPLLPQYRLPASPAPKPSRRPPLLAVFFSLAAVLLLLLLSLAGVQYRSQRSPIVLAGDTLGALDTPPSPTDDLLSPTRSFLLSNSTTNRGVVPFRAFAFSPLYRPAPLQHPLSTLSWPSSACLEQYVAEGNLCSAARRHWIGDSAPKLDVVWTWTNGSSEEAMAEWMSKISDEVGRFARMKKRASDVAKAIWRREAGGAVIRHFREHDELRYSIRSILAALPSSTLSTLHLVVGDSAAYSPSLPPSRPSNETFDPSTSRLAQIPHWAALPSLEFAQSSQEERNDSPVLVVHPHSQLFRTPEKSQNVELAEAEAREWQAGVLPSFNSLAIESQLANLETSPTALYLNDDFFIMRDLSMSDIDSPLSGPVFRMQRDLLVGAVDPKDTHDDPDGEWRGLGYSAWLLNERFGKRRRPYLIHVAKTVSVPILKELQQVFATELTATAAARFRGKGPNEVQPLFLLTMYTIEKHREALLWSFLVARSDSDASGTYSLPERQSLLSILGYVSPPTSDSSSTVLSVPYPLRSSLALLPEARNDAGLPDPKQTVLEFSSKDGYAFFATEDDVPEIPQIRKWPLQEYRDERDDSPICTLDLVDCVGEEFLPTSISAKDVSVDATFKRIAFEKPQCGDCLISLLVGRSGEKGIEAFLPPASSESSSTTGERGVEAQAIALDGRKWSEQDFSAGVDDGEGSLRSKAAALIQRYSYTIGDSPAAFRSIKYGGSLLSATLDALSNPTSRPAFVALNDDLATIKEETLVDVDVRLKAFFDREWPEKSPWEA